MEGPVAVGVQIYHRGATLEQYDQVAEVLGLLPGSPMPWQGLFHWVTKTHDGIRVVDVWQSRDAFEKFLDEKVVPIYRDIGVTDPPEIKFFDVHNYFAGSRRGV
jgi:hypothetical protein